MAVGAQRVSSESVALNTKVNIFVVAKIFFQSCSPLHQIKLIFNQYVTFTPIVVHAKIDNLRWHV